MGTIAASVVQHVQGQYNIKDNAKKYAHIVGNGTADDARSNAHTVDWDGNAWYAGAIKVGGTGQDDTAAVEVATQTYVDNKLASALPQIVLIDKITSEEYIVCIENGNLVSYPKES